MKPLFSIVLILSLLQSANGTWLDRKAEGWAWYEDKKQPKEPDPEPNATAQEQIAEIRKDLEEKLSQAVLNPTEHNVRCYMIEQKKWMDHSSRFANSWSRVLLQHPELDPTITNPVTQYGIQLQKEIEYEYKKRFIADLSIDHGLFFFYEGSSKISQGLSHVVKNFSEKYNWLAVAISVDGSIIDGFQNSKIDNGVAQKLGITTFPAIFIINPKDQIAMPIAFGLVSLDQIEDRIVLQFTTPKEEPL